MTYKIKPEDLFPLEIIGKAKAAESRLYEEASAEQNYKKLDIPELDNVATMEDLREAIESKMNEPLPSNVPNHHHIPKSKHRDSSQSMIFADMNLNKPVNP